MKSKTKKIYPECLMSFVSWKKDDHEDKVISYSKLDFEVLFNLNYEGLFGWSVFMIYRKSKSGPIEVTYRRKKKALNHEI